jgi:TolB protein
MHAGSIATLLLSLPLASSPVSPVPTVSPGEEIVWSHGSFDRIAAQAAQEEKDVLVYFWSDTSQACGDYFQNQLQDERVVAATRPFVCLSAQLETPEGKRLFDRYGIRTLPTLWVLDAEGGVQDGIEGAANVPTLVHDLKRIARDEDTLRDFVARTQASPEDLDLRNQLAGKYDDLGFPDKAAELARSIRADDPEGRTAAAAEMYLADARNGAIVEAATAADLDVEGFSSYVEAVGPPAVRSRGWDVLSGFESARGNLEGELAALRRSFPDVPDGRLFNWGWNTALWLWSNRDVLSKEDRAFALEVARKTAQVSERLSQEDPEYFDPGLFLTRRLNSLAMMLYMQGQKAEATALMERCVELYPPSGEYAARLALYRGQEADRPLGAYSDWGASWSPNGKKVVFTSTRDRNAEIYVADVKRGKLQRVTRCQESDDHAAFTHDGKGVVFASDRFKTNTIYRAKANGTDCAQVVSLGEDRYAPASSGAPALSRDGKALAMIRSQGAAPRATVAAADGSAPRALTSDSEGEDSIDWLGNRLVYSSSRGGERDVFAADADGSNERNLTAGAPGSWDTEVSGSRDGKTVVFTSWRTGQAEVWAVDADGSDLRQLTDSPETQDRRPALSPNGKSIVFDRAGADGTSRLWIMDADGSDQRPLFEE